MCAARVKAGDVLGGKYQVERVLGTGGMGIVVAARHVELGQTVALKFMLPEALADPDNAERFLREAQAAVQLRSIHTARILDVGRFENDEPFMVMEYLEGRDLDDEVAEHGPVPPHVAVDYVIQASEALAEAHALGMVHRDVKLKNLFLTRTVDGRPLVKVLDFGLAKTGARHRAGVSLTAMNSVFGSPQYMSPEQMRSAKDVDLRTDVWAMGVCLYEMLTGRLPFDAEGIAEVCAMVLKDPVLPPSHLVAGIPPEVEHAVLRCLEKDREHRFQSFAELAAALEPYANASHGAARRIVNVMHSARASISDGTALEHVVDHDGPWDEGPRTDGWDTAMHDVPDPRARPRAPLGFALAGVAAAAVVLVFAAGMQRLQAVPETAAAAQQPVTPVAPLPPQPDPLSLFPPPTVAPPSTAGTLIGASPADTLDLAPPPRPGARRASTTPRTPPSVRTSSIPIVPPPSARPNTL